MFSVVSVCLFRGRVSPCSPVADPGRGFARESCPPGPVKISHKKDGRQRQLHRFHVSRPPYLAAGSATAAPGPPPVSPYRGTPARPQSPFADSLGNIVNKFEHSTGKIFVLSLTGREVKVSRSHAHFRTSFCLTKIATHPKPPERTSRKKHLYSCCHERTKLIDIVIDTENS